MTNEMSQSITLMKERGVILGQGASEIDLEKFVKFTGNRIGKDLLDVYAILNGFSYDHRSYIRLWNIKQILEEQEAKGLEYIIIGDFLIESDYIIAKLTTGSAEVHLLHDGRLMASSVHEFIAHIASGKFDFVRQESV